MSDLQKTIKSLTTLIAESNVTKGHLNNGIAYYSELVRRNKPKGKLNPEDLKKLKPADLKKHQDYINAVEKLINFQDRKFEEQNIVRELSAQLEVVENHAQNELENNIGQSLKVVPKEQKEEKPKTESPASSNALTPLGELIKKAEELINSREIKGPAMVNLQNLLIKRGTENEPANFEALLKEFIETAVNG